MNSDTKICFRAFESELKNKRESLSRSVEPPETMIRGSCSFRASRSSFFCVAWMWMLGVVVLGLVGLDVDFTREEEEGEEEEERP